MARIVTRTVKLGATLSRSTAANIWTGAGVLVGLRVDYAAAADAGTLLKMYDTVLSDGTAINAAKDPAIFVGTAINTDFGTTVPNRVFTDGDLVAGTSTANVKAGIPFAHGLYAVVSLDVAGPQTITAWIKPLIRKIVNVKTAGSAGSAVGSRQLFSGPGLLHGLRLTANPLAPSTMDFLIKDGIANEIAGTGAGSTLLTKTNYSNAALAVRPVVTTTNVDDVQATVTTAATGAYANDGILFENGLNVSVQQADALDNALDVEALIEA